MQGAEGEYVEMDVDLHSVPSAIRKGLQPFKNHLSDCVVDIAVILQVRGGALGSQHCRCL